MNNPLVASNTANFVMILLKMIDSKKGVKEREIRSDRDNSVVSM